MWAITKRGYYHLSHNIKGLALGKRSQQSSHGKSSRSVYPWRKVKGGSLPNFPASFRWICWTPASPEGPYPLGTPDDFSKGASLVNFDWRFWALELIFCACSHLLSPALICSPPPPRHWLAMYLINSLIQNHEHDHQRLFSPCQKKGNRKDPTTLIPFCCH